MINVECYFDGLQGADSVGGPLLTFQVRIRYSGDQNDPSMVYLLFKGGVLSAQTSRGFETVGFVYPRIHGITLAKGGEGVVGFDIQLSREAFERLLEDLKGRVFQLMVEITTVPMVERNIDSLFNSFMRLVWSQAHYVRGKVGGVDNLQLFQVDLETWERVVEATKVGAYLTDVILVRNADREPIKTLYGYIREAEGLLNKGEIKEATGKIREICERMGHKPKGKPDRYATLDRFDLQEREKEGLKGVLDALWGWTSPAHHVDASGRESFTEEQARMAIHLAYSILAYLSHKQMIRSS